MQAKLPRLRHGNKAEAAFGTRPEYKPHPGGQRHRGIPSGDAHLQIRADREIIWETPRHCSRSSKTGRPNSGQRGAPVPTGATERPPERTGEVVRDASQQGQHRSQRTLTMIQAKPKIVPQTLPKFKAGEDIDYELTRFNQHRTTYDILRGSGDSI